MRRTRRLAAAGLLLLLLAWLGGFLLFVRDVTRTVALPPAADGIVVLTGGADRIATGLRLLQDGCCGLLLISGVGRGADLDALLRGSGVAADPLADRITLGREAADTAGNAREIADWARAHRLRSLIVVTAFYHMPRALMELGRQAPELAFYARPVAPAAARSASPAVVALLAHEYIKLIGAALGLGRPARVPG